MKQTDFSHTIKKVNGNTLRLLSETSAALLWEGETPGGAKFWEVWKVRIRKTDKTLPSGKVLKAGEFISPSNEDFGVHAWSYIKHKCRAIARVEELNNLIERRRSA